MQIEMAMRVPRAVNNVSEFGKLLIMLTGTNTLDAVENESHHLTPPFFL